MKVFLIIFVIVSFLYSCRPKSEPLGLNNLIKNYVDSISKINTTDSFKMNLFLEVPLDWDELAIINPYTPVDTIKNQGYTNLYSNLSDIKNFTYREEYVTIVLSKNKRILSLDTVRRMPIDYVQLKLSSKINSINILYKDQVKNLIYIKHYTDSQKNYNFIPKFVVR